MIIGTPMERKPGEMRVVLTPIEVAELIADGHTVLVEKHAGHNAGFSDEEYFQAGAQIREGLEEIYAEADMIVKMKEILPEEYGLLRENQILFTCIHPAANKEEVAVLLEKKCIGFSAEDSHRFGSPNCEVAGKLGALMGVFHLLSTNGGRGQLICSVGGAPGANVLILGAGLVGKSAATIVSALGARVTMMDIHVGPLRECQSLFSANVHTMISNQSNIRKLLPQIDLVLNCVKWPKHRKDHLITRDMVKSMKKGSVIVDISADVGGAIETYQQTTHDKPTYVIDGVIHYGVDNIPAAAPYTTSIAYAASVFPHIRSIANNGITEACKRDGYLRRSLTVYCGMLTHDETAVIQSLPFTPPEEALGLTEKDELDWAPSATTTKVRQKQ